MAQTLPSGIKTFDASDTVNRAAFNENWNTVDSQLANKPNKSDLVFNVKDFGAKGDDSDDTSAIQAAINAARAVGGVVRFPSVPYWYRITDTLDIPSSVRLIGDNWSFNGSTLLRFYMDGKAMNRPAIKVHGAQNVHIENLYVQNMGTQLRDGIAIDGSVGGNNAFVSCHNVISSGWGKNFYVNNTWMVSFRDCYGKAGTYGWYVAGGTITTCLIDHCYAESNTQDGYFLNGAYYSTFIGAASDFCNIGFNIFDSHTVSLVGCGCEETKATAINLVGSTVVIDGFASVANGTDTDINYGTMLNANNCRLSVRGLYEHTLASPNSKIASVVINDGTTGDYVSCRELLQIIYPKNGRFLFNGQAFSSGLPSATGWKSEDIGKVVYNHAATEQGSSPNKYVVYGYRRMTVGNGNTLGTDWLALRALTGN
jgi:hypothetical protein